jgi:hypothetical protein
MSNFLGVGTDDALNGSQDPLATVTAGASPWTYTAPFKCHVNLSGGTVSAVAHGRNNVFHSLGGVAGSFSLSKGDQIKVTYSAAPTVVVIPA